ncbi:putative Glyoxylate reductase [Candidatus Hydrogenisulfobacillus filiaventi]|uniref:Putative Glyoxylate reductase n=1 Tax=Candidatus Hydrogenisulfobacillus filiaventi TaxID=2707344 RepID=A0A6F8ZEW6_9FIRM|nr:putative Glyoxylate reductase [Candidatus Hydrogenisulfobacillus filiaventi]
MAPVVLSFLSSGWVDRLGLEDPDDLEVLHWSRPEPVPPALAAAADAFLVGRTPVGAALLEKAPRLRFVQTVGSGHEQVDLAAALARGVTVAHNPGHNAQAVAEHLILSALYLLRRMGEAHHAVLEGRFQERETLVGPGLRDLSGLQWGIVGLGHIGRALAGLAAPFGVRLLYYQRHRDLAAEARLGLRYLPLTELLAQADVVSVALPSTPETRGLFDDRLFVRMRSGAVFLNVGRGDVVDSAALRRALINGPLYGAALDVFDQEPPDPGHPLLTLPPEVRRRVLYSPHIAGVTAQAYRAMVEAAWANIRRFFQGLPVLNVLSAADL